MRADAGMRAAVNAQQPLSVSVQTSWHCQWQTGLQQCCCTFHTWHYWYHPI